MANGRRWGVRGIVSLLIFIIATLSTPIAVVGNWGHRTVTDAEVYLQTVGPLASDPAIQAAVAEKVTQVISDQVDTTSLVDGFLGNFIKNPEITDKLTAPIAAGIDSLINNLVASFIASDAFQKMWLGLNEAAQKSLVALLQGKNEGPIQVTDSKVVLDISSLLTVIQQKLVEGGLSVAANVTVPDNDRQIVLLDSPMIGTVQTIYSLTSPLLAFYPLIVAVLFALSIALARNRPRTVLATGIALIASSLALTFSLDWLRNLVTSQYQGSLMASALNSFWNTFFVNLVDGIWGVFVLGIFIGLAGWYAGRSRPATRIREAVCDGLHQAGDIGSKGLNTWVRSYAAVLRWAVGIVLILILVLVGEVTPVRVFWLCALAAGLFTLIELFNAPDREVVVEEIVVIETA